MSLANFVQYVLPILNTAQSCTIYKHEIITLNKKIAEIFEKKNIYDFLDFPDLKIIQKKYLTKEVLKISFKRMNLIGEIFDNNNLDKIYVQINKLKYNVIIFPTGEIPTIVTLKKPLIIFSYEPTFQKVFYLGKLNLSNKNTEIINQTNFLKNTQKFIGFNNLVK